MAPVSEVALFIVFRVLRGLIPQPGMVTQILAVLMRITAPFQHFHKDLHIYVQTPMEAHLLPNRCVPLRTQVVEIFRPSVLTLLVSNNQ